jgi:hypothetical protein
MNVPTHLLFLLFAFLLFSCENKCKIKIERKAEGISIIGKNWKYTYETNTMLKTRPQVWVDNIRNAIWVTDVTGLYRIAENTGKKELIFNGSLRYGYLWNVKMQKLKQEYLSIQYSDNVALIDIKTNKCVFSLIDSMEAGCPERAIDGFTGITYYEETPESFCGKKKCLYGEDQECCYIFPKLIKL